MFRSFLWIAADALRVFSKRRARPKRSLRNRPRLVVQRLEDRWSPATLTWTGAAGNAAWNEPANWSPIGPGVFASPGQDDSVIFDQTSSADCTINSATDLTVRGLVVDHYGGTLTIGPTVNVT